MLLMVVFILTQDYTWCAIASGTAYMAADVVLAGPASWVEG